MSEHQPNSTPPAWPDETIAITGLGAVSAWGWSLEQLWQGLISGAAAIAPARQFDTTGHRTELASEVPPPPADLISQWTAEEQRWSRADNFAVAAARQAWKMAGLGESTAQGVGDTAGAVGDTAEAVGDAVIGGFFGGSTAAMAEGEEFFARLVGLRSGRPSISLLASHQINGPGDAVARHLGLTGPVQTLSSACSSGGLALGAALDALRTGEVDVAVAGGADSLCQLTYAGFNSLRAVDPERCSPFRQQRAGLNLGEGAGMLVLERLDRARRRGARPWALLLGSGASCDAHHMTAPHPEGEGAARAIREAIRDAGLDHRDIAFINAHGTGTPLNDKSEWGAMAAVFGERAPTIPVTSTKGVIGHFLGSSGAIEAVTSALCLHHGLIHATPGRGPIDENLEVDLVHGEPRLITGSCALSTSFAFGGSNAAVVLAAAEGDRSDS